MGVEAKEIAAGIAQAEAAFAAEVREIQAEVAERILTAARNHQAKIAAFRQRLALLALAPDSGTDVEFGKPEVVVANPSGARPRRPALTLMWNALKEGNKSAKEIDDMVMAEGWSRSMSEKAKAHLKTAGLALNQSRVWFLTDEGRRKAEAGEEL
ncbi:MAG: hypothetical protein HEQ16_13085 [Bosea sp.]|nr:hypothetical protein [Bosea sp. (in: a-proteobacteria)]